MFLILIFAPLKSALNACNLSVKVKIVNLIHIKTRLSYLRSNYTSLLFGVDLSTKKCHQNVKFS